MTMTPKNRARRIAAAIRIGLNMAEKGLTEAAALADEEERGDLADSIADVLTDLQSVHTAALTLAQPAADHFGDDVDILSGGQDKPPEDGGGPG